MIEHTRPPLPEHQREIAPLVFHMAALAFRVILPSVQTFLDLETHFDFRMTRHAFLG